MGLLYQSPCQAGSGGDGWGASIIVYGRRDAAETAGADLPSSMEG
jgi:hypothetical protein